MVTKELQLNDSSVENSMNPGLEQCVIMESSLGNLLWRFNKWQILKDLSEKIYPMNQN